MVLSDKTDLTTFVTLSKKARRKTTGTKGIYELELEPNPEADKLVAESIEKILRDNLTAQQLRILEMPTQEEDV